MDNLAMQAAAVFLAGVILGYLLGTWRGRRSRRSGMPGSPDWWKTRKVLTGTQLQILQYMEATREATIGALQKKFSFIPDRELYYRLEQIFLMGFLVRERRDNEMIYKLNPEYSATVEDDKTKILSDKRS